MKSYQVLTHDEVEFFVEQGYVVVRGATPREDALKIQKRVFAKVFEASGMNPEDPSTWTKSMFHLQETFRGPEIDAAFTPRLLAAMEDLTGVGRLDLQKQIGWFPTTFPGFTPVGPWIAPTDGWHIDGSWFHHHLNSKEQALLPIHLYTDISPGGGGTAIIPGSHLYGAKVLAQSEPAGQTSQEICDAIQPYAKENLHRAIETTGEVGDVVLLHPFMMHSVSMNTGTRVRVIANPCQSYKEPMKLEPQYAAEYSPVERAIVLGAGMAEKVGV